MKYNVLNINKAKKVGWKPKHSLFKGIEKCHAMNSEIAKIHLF
jgi:hypothetical protein